jgi:hypothetical protein
MHRLLRLDYDPNAICIEMHRPQRFPRPADREPRALLSPTAQRYETSGGRSPALAAPWASPRAYCRCPQAWRPAVPQRARAQGVEPRNLTRPRGALSAKSLDPTPRSRDQARAREQRGHPRVAVERACRRAHLARGAGGEAAAGAAAKGRGEFGWSGRKRDVVGDALQRAVGAREAAGSGAAPRAWSCRFWTS